MAGNPIADDRRAYDEDPREACKYGETCYQKNPLHRKKFKHPPKQHNNDGKRVTQSQVISKKRSHEAEVEGPKAKRLNAEEEEEEESEEDLPASPQDVKDNIRQKFLVEMPDDFYSFWELCESLDSKHPEDAFRIFGLKLVGPYDVISGKLAANRKQSKYLCHWRYFFDPPEFQAVIKGDDKTQFHVGYFRDAPDEMPALVASNVASSSCVFRPLGENLFSAVNCILTDNETKVDSKRLKQFKESLERWAKRNKFTLEMKTNKMKERDRKVVTKGFHGLGIVIPFDKNTQVGYRPLPETDGNLKKILKAIVECKTEAERDRKFANLQEIITLVQFANDECDYGMGFELSIALFCFGDPYFHRIILHLMPLAYELLRRPQFARILKAHLKNRLKDSPIINRKE